MEIKAVPMPKIEQTEPPSPTAIGYRGYEILAELEEANGTIITPGKTSLSAHFRSLNINKTSRETHRHPLARLQDLGLVAISEDGREVTLEDEGQCAIEAIKAKPFADPASASRANKRMSVIIGKAGSRKRKYSAQNFCRNIPMQPFSGFGFKLLITH